MNFIDNFRIFAFCTLSLIGRMQVRSVSYSQIGDIRIEQDANGKWLCDKIECPVDTYRCFVSKSNEKDPSVLVRTNICYSHDNRVLAKKVTSTSIDPNSNIRIVVNSYRNGMTTTSNSLSNSNSSDPGFDEEKFQRELQQQLQGINSNLNNEMRNLDSNLKAMQHNLAHMFD